MAITEAELTSVITELSTIAGAKIQRADVVDERTVVFELRCPGRTFRILLAADPKHGRMYAMADKPRRVIDGGPFQALLRKRLVGRVLTRFESEGRTVRLYTPDGGLEVELGKTRDAFRFLDGAMPAPTSSGEPRVEFQALVLPASAALEARYAAEVPEEIRARLSASLGRVLAAAHKKLVRKRARIRADQARLGELAVWGRYGELLKGGLSQVERGRSSVTLKDWASGESVEVPLDPSLSAQDNMKRCFDRAKRAGRGLPQVQVRLAQVEAELGQVSADQARLALADEAELIRIAGRHGAGEGVRARQLGASGSAPSKRHPLDAVSRAFHAADGSEIRVGKDAAGNDRLTFNGARGDDIWLHARGTAGAHVILRVQKGKSPGAEALLDAAHLAAHHSEQRGEAKVEVIYTEARHVKKTKGAPAGQVGVARSKTMLVVLEPARIARLFGVVTGH